uniref:Uncharacterized protein n=1 Tax=Panagrolaimus sp. JU765 TaxID=591449 RepID=A0AC34Q7Q6_9BILA
MASIGRSAQLLSIFNGKNDKRNYYSFEPLYEELNDLRNRKSRQTCACCSYLALALDIFSLSIITVGFVLFVLFYFSSTETMTNLVNSFSFGTNESTINENVDGNL